MRPSAQETSLILGFTIGTNLAAILLLFRYFGGNTVITFVRVRLNSPTFLMATSLLVLALSRIIAALFL